MTSNNASDNATLEALSIVSWYASALADSAKKDGRIREDALLDVMELIEASALPNAERAAVAKASFAVLRCAKAAWNAAREKIRRKTKKTWNRRARRGVLVASVVLTAAAIYFQWESVAYLAFACFVGVACPSLASWMRAIGAERFSQTRRKNERKE